MKTKNASVIATNDLQIGFPAKAGDSPAVVASAINVELRRGQVVCLLGPNGSGKSTLIRTLAGLHPPLAGDIQLEGRNLQDFRAREAATKISTVLTDRLTVGNLSVYEVISFGRSPYTGWFGSLSSEDEQMIQRAIASTGIEALVDRDVLHLSDGERQKVMIARALAQDTSTILLDEPTAHLDLPNRVEIIRLLRDLSGDTRKGILFSTHELDLALRSADRLWLISREGQVVTGTPEDLVLGGDFELVFEQDSFQFDRSTGSFQLHQTGSRQVKLEGDPVGVFWTRRALQRQLWRVTEGPAPVTVQVMQDEERYQWALREDSDGQVQKLSSVETLLKAMQELHY